MTTSSTSTPRLTRICRCTSSTAFIWSCLAVGPELFTIGDHNMYRRSKVAKCFLGVVDVLVELVEEPSKRVWSRTFNVLQPCDKVYSDLAHVDDAVGEVHRHDINLALGVRRVQVVLDEVASSVDFEVQPGILATLFAIATPMRCDDDPSPANAHSVNGMR